MAQGTRYAFLKSGGAFMGQSKAPIMDLYRSICREIPRVLTIYDVDIDRAVARRKISDLFRENAHVQDPAIVKILVSNAYMELEETVLQFKQKTHLMRILGDSMEEYRPPPRFLEPTDIIFQNRRGRFL